MKIEICIVIAVLVLLCCSSSPSNVFVLAQNATVGAGNTTTTAAGTTTTMQVSTTSAAGGSTTLATPSATTTGVPVTTTASPTTTTPATPPPVPTTSTLAPPTPSPTPAPPPTTTLPTSAPAPIWVPSFAHEADARGAVTFIALIMSLCHGPTLILETQMALAGFQWSRCANASFEEATRNLQKPLPFPENLLPFITLGDAQNGYFRGVIVANVIIIPCVTAVVTIIYGYVMHNKQLKADIKSGGKKPVASGSGNAEPLLAAAAAAAAAVTSTDGGDNKNAKQKVPGFRDTLYEWMYHGGTASTVLVLFTLGTDGAIAAIGGISGSPRESTQFGVDGALLIVFVVFFCVLNIMAFKYIAGNTPERFVSGESLISRVPLSKPVFEASNELVEKLRAYKWGRFCIMGTHVWRPTSAKTTQHLTTIPLLFKFFHGPRQEDRRVAIASIMGIDLSKIPTPKAAPGKAPGAGGGGGMMRFVLPKDGKAENNQQDDASPSDASSGAAAAQPPSSSMMQVRYRAYFWACWFFVHLSFMASVALLRGLAREKITPGACQGMAGISAGLDVVLAILVMVVRPFVVPLRNITCCVVMSWCALTAILGAAGAPAESIHGMTVVSAILPIVGFLITGLPRCVLQTLYMVMPMPHTLAAVLQKMDDIMNKQNKKDDEEKSPPPPAEDEQQQQQGDQEMQEQPPQQQQQQQQPAAEEMYKDDENVPPEGGGPLQTGADLNNQDSIVDPAVQAGYGGGDGSQQQQQQQQLQQQAAADDDIVLPERERRLNNVQGGAMMSPTSQQQGGVVTFDVNGDPIPVSSSSSSKQLENESDEAYVERMMNLQVAPQTPPEDYLNIADGVADEDIGDDELEGELLSVEEQYAMMGITADELEDLTGNNTNNNNNNNNNTKQQQQIQQSNNPSFNRQQQQHLVEQASAQGGLRPASLMQQEAPPRGVGPRELTQEQWKLKGQEQGWLPSSSQQQWQPASDNSFRQSPSTSCGGNNVSPSGRPRQVSFAGDHHNHHSHHHDGSPLSNDEVRDLLGVDPSSPRSGGGDRGGRFVDKSSLTPQAAKFMEQFERRRNNGELAIQQQNQEDQRRWEQAASLQHQHEQANRKPRRGDPHVTSPRASKMSKDAVDGLLDDIVQTAFSSPTARRAAQQNLLMPNVPVQQQHRGGGGGGASSTPRRTGGGAGVGSPTTPNRVSSPTQLQQQQIAARDAPLYHVNSMNYEPEVLDTSDKAQMEAMMRSAAYL